MKESIVNTASNVFRKYGYRKTTMDDIATALGKGKSSIYYYFRNKEEIFQAVLEQEMILRKSILLKVVNHKKHHKGKLKAYIVTRIKEYESMINFSNAVTYEYLPQFEFIEQFRRKYDQEEIATVQGILEEGVEKGDFRIGNPSLAAVALVMVLKGFEIPMNITGKKRQDIEQLVDNFLKMLFNGILNK